MIESFFNNIQKQIAERLADATSRVYIAVAWFTNDTLFKEVIKCCKSGLDVSVIIMDDYINRNEYALDFSELINSGGRLFLSKEKKMHNKFCIIDNMIVTGSYNWTYYAENLNFENIVLTDDSSLVNTYIEEFRKIIESSIQVINYQALPLSGMSDEEIYSDYKYLIKDLTLKSSKFIDKIENFNKERNIKLIIESNHELEYDNRRIPLLKQELEPSHLEYRLINFSIGIVPYNRPNAGKKYVHAKLCSNQLYDEDVWVDVFDDVFVNDVLNYFHKNEGGLVDDNLSLPPIPENIYNPRGKYRFGLICYHFNKYGKYGNERNKIDNDGRIIIDKYGNPYKYSKFYTMSRFDSEIQERQNSCYLIVQSLFIPNGIDDIEKKMNSAMDFLS